MSPRSRGRPPGRGRRQQARRPGARPGGPHLAAVPAGGETHGYEEETTDCWFDEPEPGDRRSWALPPAHGTYQGLDLELLDPVGFLNSATGVELDFMRPVRIR